MTNDSALDPVLATTGYATWEALRAFAECGSFAKAAEALNLNSRQVSKLLIDFNNSYRHHRGGASLLIRRNSKVWDLTALGRRVAAKAPDVLSSMSSALEIAHEVQVPIVYSSNCVGELSTLNDKLRNKDFSLKMQSEPSSDIQMDQLSAMGYPLAFFSMLMPVEDGAQAVRRGELWSHNGLELLPLRVERLQLLCSPQLGLPSGPVEMQDVVSRGAIVMTPEGGVAKDYLDKTQPRLAHLRPAQWLRIHGSHVGLETLKHRLDPKRVMIVHGRDENEFEGIPHVEVHDFADDPDQRWCAVTGLVRLKHKLFDTPEINEIWDIALSLWALSERVVALDAA